MYVLPKIYQKRRSRLSLNFLISLAVCKVAYDFTELRLKYSAYKIPRIVIKIKPANGN